MTILQRPHPGKELQKTVQGITYDRFPVKTDRIDEGADLVQIIKNELQESVASGDIILVAESVVAIAEGRSYKFDEIEYGWVAKKLARYVTKTPAGIGLGTPETMQLAINEVGVLRILFATSVGAISKLFGFKGNFYRIAGSKVRAIDGPTSGTLPPYNGYASLSPEDPRGFALELEKALLPAEVEVIVIDANDIGVNILGARNREQELRGEALASDNPLGQGSEQTPVLLCKKIMQD